MANIKVYLLGRPYVEMDGERVNFPYKKAEGFFYYLCVKKTATREKSYLCFGERTTKMLEEKTLEKQYIR